MSQNNDYKVWQTEELSKSFLEGVRSAIPLATEQIKCLIQVISLTQSSVRSFIDLGRGNGVLGKAIYEYYPQARGFFIDISETMLQVAGKNLKEYQSNTQFILQDFGRKNWIDCLRQESPFDVIVSGFAIHQNYH